MLGWLFLALMATLVVLAVVALIRGWSGLGRIGPVPYQGPAPGFDPALAELRVRYARGEIGWDEYAQRGTHLGFPISPSGGPGSWGAPRATNDDAP
jgi:uncharacterized membrane protein